MGAYSKFIGSLVGGLAGIAVNKFGVPQDVATPDIQAAIVVLLSAIATYFFPANKPKA